MNRLCGWLFVLGLCLFFNHPGGALAFQDGDGSDEQASLARGYALWMGKGWASIHGESATRHWAREEGPLLMATCRMCHSRVVRGRRWEGLANQRMSLDSMLDGVRQWLRANTTMSLLRLLSPRRVIHLGHQAGKWKRLFTGLKEDCGDGLPGTFPSLKFWQRLTDMDGAAKGAGVPCGFGKIPSLFGLAHRQQLFQGGEVKTTSPVLVPGSDLVGYDRAGPLGAFLLETQAGRDLTAYLQRGVRIPRWSELSQDPIDPPLVRQGYALFHEGVGCSGCHGVYSPSGQLQSYDERVIALGRVQTHGERVEGIRPSLLQGYAWSEAIEVVKMGEGEGDTPLGYVAMPLCGTAFSAPYLHTGAIPNLMALLTPASQRQLQWWSGAYLDGQVVGFSDDYDRALALVGGRSRDLEAIRVQREVVMGHSGLAFGTELAEGEKVALVEYLKVLGCGG